MQQRLKFDTKGTCWLDDVLVFNFYSCQDTEDGVLSKVYSQIYLKQNVEVYTARNNHFPSLNPFAISPVPTGVYHGAELLYLFKNLKLSRKEVMFRLKLRRLLRFFAGGSAPQHIRVIPILHITLHS